MKTTTTNKTFEQLLKANNFGYKYITDSYKPEKPKKVTVEVELWHPNKITTNQEFLDYCKANNSRPATFNEALQFALDNPDEQLKYSLITYDLRQLCCLCLDRYDVLRRVNVGRDGLDGRWLEFVRFLLVRELPLVPSSLGASGSLELGTLTLTINGKSYKYKQVEE